MARYTTAYSSFLNRLGEVEILRRFAATKERQDAVRLRNDINALCRGAVVLLSGHLEAFVKELGEIALDALYTKSVERTKIDPAFFYHISKDILDELSETREPGRSAEKVFAFVSSDAPYWCRSGPFPQPVPSERFNKGFANPAFDKIRSYFNRFGYGDYKRDLAQRLKAEYTATENMIDHLVAIRNKIAHGDSLATKTPLEVSEMMTVIKKYCMVTDSVFAAWCKKELCTIR
jgi:hypothetical protein